MASSSCNGMIPALRRQALRSQLIPISRSRIPMASCSACSGIWFNSGPSSRTAPANNAKAAPAPSAAGRQLRGVATASTIVNASTTSTSEARKAAPTAGAAVDQISMATLSKVFLMRLEAAWGARLAPAFAGFEPLGGFDRQFRVIEIELFDLLEPDLKLLQVDVVFLQLRVRKVLGGGFLGDLGFEIVALVDQLAVGLVTIGLEAGDDLLLLGPVERERFQDHCLAADLGDIVFQHLEPPRVVVGFRQQAHAVLQINRPHSLPPAPQ